MDSTCGHSQKIIYNWIMWEKKNLSDELKRKYLSSQVKKVYGPITGNYYTNFSMCKAVEQHFSLINYSPKHNEAHTT